jgi:4-carboxymuconolactone decarboxylase
MTDNIAPRKSPFADIAPALGDYTDNVLFGDVRLSAAVPPTWPFRPGKKSLILSH